MPTQKRTKVLIAGGSIAGLTLANILEQLGIDYLVLEKYGNIAPDLGASIAIFPNGFRILDQLGCYDAIKALIADADGFKTMAMRDEHGKIISQINNGSINFSNRLGYVPIFVDRQMIIQVLYDNLRDKSKVLTSKGVAKIDQKSGEVTVTTESGDMFTGDILVGADGIHSTVRREMWRLADHDSPGYFSVKEREEVPTEYCCIFGISNPTDKFPKDYSQHVRGQDHSYLIAIGPNQRIYWFLFKKLPETTRGLYGKIPRYTDEQREALVAEHANDPITETLTFGDLYAMRATATLQALPEVVFEKWHYNRIITIGDAAHKFNPIGGQGGNSAIEDAAVLADQLHNLFNNQTSTPSYTDADFAQVFQETQRIRFPRATKFIKYSRDMQSVQALDGLVSKFIARYVIPWSSSESVIRMICEGSQGAARIEALPLPGRPHSELWDDERQPSAVDWKRVGAVASVAVAVLAGLAASNVRLPIGSLPKFLLSIQSK